MATPYPTPGEPLEDPLAYPSLATWGIVPELNARASCPPVTKGFPDVLRGIHEFPEKKVLRKCFLLAPVEAHRLRDNHHGEIENGRDERLSSPSHKPTST